MVEAEVLKKSSEAGALGKTRPVFLCCLSERQRGDEHNEMLKKEIRRILNIIEYEMQG
jgi:hypothetical protein